MFDKLTANDLKKIELLKREKYDTWSWTYGRSPEFTFESKQRWDGGIIDVKANVTNGIIRDIKFYGDFLSLMPLYELEHSIIGTRFMRYDVQKCIDNFGSSGIPVGEECRFAQ